MQGNTATWAGIYGASGIALCLGADTRLTANQAARMIQIQSLAATNSLTTPSEDLEVLYCLKQVMRMAAV